uniref:Tight junction protein 3 n=1 Tax=Maylandia zebra TaxID=106582 RepID=A0A3P9BWK4_9CICH
MEEITIWEQHTITLNKDSKLGFGFAISGGRDKPQPDGDTSILVSDVLPNGPAMGRLFTKDQIVMVNGEPMDNVHSNYTIQTLKSCGKTANITVKRPRKIQIPATSSTRPTRAASHSNLLDADPPRRPTPERNGLANAAPLISSGYKRLPLKNVSEKPIRTTLIKKKTTDVERLNYIQYHPMVLFLDPHNRKDVKTMRQRYSPKSSKSSRRLYSQAIKMRKHCSHLFSARVDLDPSSHSWYESLKNKIRHEQTKPVWVSEVTLESGGEQDLDALDQNQTDYLSAASDLEDTDGEGFTDDAYTDNEELEEAYPGQNTAKVPGGSRVAGAALARSSEPAFEHHSPSIEPEESDDAYGVREIPPIMHVPEPRSPRHANYSPPQSDAEEEDPSHRSFTDSDFSALDVASHAAPSEGPPDFRAPDPTSQYSVDDLSAIEDRLEQVCCALIFDPSVLLPYRLAHHHQAVQFRRTQIQGSDSSEDEFDDADDMEWGPATEL